MALYLKQSYDEGFCKLMDELRKKYPEELFRIEGIHEDQTDINHTAWDFFRTTERKGSATADHSIDPNANVAGRDVITFNFEVPKPLMKLNSLFNMWKGVSALGGEEMAARVLEDEIRGAIYINDAHDMARPYCFNYSTLDIALEGLPHVGRLTIKPPKSLSSFLHQVEQFVTTAANMTLGATGLADILIVASWYVDRILETGKDHKIVVGRENAISYVRELLTHFIYTVNYEFRGNQSPFTNVSLYDKHFREQLIPAYAIQGISPKDSTVDMVQKMYMDIFREELRREPLTFPVTTACFSTEEVNGERRIRDLDFLDAVSGYNLEQGFINYYMGDTSTLSSCCRLRSNVNDLGYANTFGAGSTKIGSLGVVTLNLPNIAFTVKGAERAKEVFFEILEDRVKDISYINQFKREFLRDRIRRGSLPLYTLGYMDLGHQYSTCGFTGLHEALEILGYDIRNEEGLSFAKEILGTINAVNDKMSAKWKAPHNMEQVPGETSSVKLARKDRIMGLNKDYELYSNQFIPLCLEGVDILDRIYLQGQLDPACTGGAICHLNVGEPIEDIGAMNAIAYQACSDGVVYFAVNYALNRCSSGHITAGRDASSCPICGSEITDTFTRVVGFLTNTKHWNKTRREVDWPNRVFM